MKKICEIDYYTTDLIFKKLRSYLFYCLGIIVQPDIVWNAS